MRRLVIIGIAAAGLLWLSTLPSEPDERAVAGPRQDFLTASVEDFSRRVNAGKPAAAGAAVPARRPWPAEPLAGGESIPASAAPPAVREAAEIWSAPAEFAPPEE